MGVGLLLRESAFVEYKCDRTGSLGMNIEALAKVFKMCGPNDSLKIRYATGADQVSFEIESEQMEIPEQQYQVVAKLPSAEFLKICRDLKEFGETVQIQANKEGLRFSVQGDLGAGNIMLKPREAEKDEEKVSLTVREPMGATFALRYLTNFAKAAPLCGAVELGLGPDAPLSVKYVLDSVDNGHLQFYLAPKVDE